MKRFFSLSALAALTITALAGIQAQAQTSYTFTDLGVQGKALGINNAGQISLTSKDNSGIFHFARITPSTDISGHQSWFVDNNLDGINDLVQNLSLPSGLTYPWSVYPGNINASGQCVATALAARNQSPQCAIGWTANGSPFLLTDTRHVGTGFGINDLGDMVGCQNVGGTANVPYIWQNSSGSYTAVQLSKNSGYALTVNNLRQVIGIAGGSNFLWLPAPAYGLAKGMNTITGINFQNGKSLNNSGYITGNNSAGHLSVWAPPGMGAAYGINGGLNDLGTVPGMSIYPSGLNNPLSGQPLMIIGWAQDTSNNQFAFVWDSNTRTISNLAVNLPLGWTMATANGINDVGQIVGNAMVNGSLHAFILTPQ